RHILSYHRAPATYTDTLSLHDALPIYKELEEAETKGISVVVTRTEKEDNFRAEDNVLDTFSVVRRMNYFNFFGDSKWEKIVKIEIGRAHSELQSREKVVCRLLREKKK